MLRPEAKPKLWLSLSGVIKFLDSNTEFFPQLVSKYVDKELERNLIYLLSCFETKTNKISKARISGTLSPNCALILSEWFL